MPGGKTTCMDIALFTAGWNAPRQGFTVCVAGNSDLEGNQKGVFMHGTHMSTPLSDHAQCQLPQALSAGVPPRHPALAIEPPSSTVLLDLTVASCPA